MHDAFDRLTDPVRRAAILERFIKQNELTSLFASWLNETGYENVLYEYECIRDGHAYLFALTTDGRLYAGKDREGLVKCPWRHPGEEGQAGWVPLERSSFVSSVKKMLRDGEFNGL